MFIKKKFDKVNGETRQCKHCNNEFYTMKPLWSCNKCQCKKQTEIRRIYLAEGKLTLKAPYPYTKISKANKKEYAPRFKKLQSILNKMKVRSEWQTYFVNRLDEVLQDEVLMKWINDRRDNETKKGKQTKSENIIKKEWPDTRGLWID
jgi:tRNA G26 N,N-dimethylase Trm1